MKLSEHITKAGGFPRTATALMCLLPILLIIPNAALDFTEGYGMASRAANILLPGGIYLLISAWGGRIGRKILLFIPLMVLCAFQIVLLFLYGEAIIAVDMFLNVATTNVHEASELLANLGTAIAVVIILYLPLIGAGIWAEVRRARIPAHALVYGRRLGIALTLLGAVASALAFSSQKGYSPGRELFPVNVLNNIAKAIERSAATAAYPIASSGYKFNAIDTDTVSNPQGKVIVVVIGETSRANHWQLGGYKRPTNPRLSRRHDILFFPKTLSESNTTHKSVPLMLSHLSATNFNDSIFITGCIVDVFKEAGYTTAWLSNQAHNHSLIDFYSQRADYCDYLCDEHPGDNPTWFDTELAPRLRDFISGLPAERNLFVVIHTYGSHFNYRERYPADEAFFQPDNSAIASKENIRDLINAYDNSILATDKALESIIETLEECGRPAAMAYAADHGEDIFDDERDRFLHASPNPTYYQIHVPMLIWMSGDFADRYPAKAKNLKEHVSKNVSSSESMFHTVADLAGLSMSTLNPASSLCSQCYLEPQRLYLNDHNGGVSLSNSGLRTEDMEMLRKNNISEK